MKITLIGAGNLATNLGKALRKAGHAIVQVYSRTRQSADQLAERLGATATTDLAAVTADAEVYVIAVKDSVLPAVIKELSQVEPLAGKTFLHTAGSVPMSVFEGCFRNYGVLYPMQTFSKDKEVEFSEIPIFVEGSNDGVTARTRQLAESVSQRVEECSSEQRRMLHLSAVFVCNFVNHCYALSAKLLERHGLSFDVMLPLIDETARKVHTMHPAEAQTGPAARNDTNVMDAQMKLLSDLPEVRELYRMMSQSILVQSSEFRVQSSEF